MYSVISRSLLSLFGPVTLAFLLASFQTAFSQTTKSEEILQGRVADSAGAALPSASVTLSNFSTGLERVAVADASGSFIFRIIRDGRYRLTVRAIEFALHPAALAERVTVVSGSRQEELRESLTRRVVRAENGKVITRVIEFHDPKIRFSDEQAAR